MSKHQLLKNPLFIVFMILLTMALAACGNDKEEKNESSKHYTIGVINLTRGLDPIVDGFKSQMTELGYVEGENVTYLYDGPPTSIDGLDVIAQKLVEADVDLILCVSTPAAKAVQRATIEKPIPCVFAPVLDPVGSGLVTSLAEPGGNITGITFGPGEAKRLEWLTRIDPSIKHVYIPYNVDDPAPNAALVLVSGSAEQLGVELVLQPARNDEEVTAALENMPSDIDAMMILPDSIVSQSIDKIIATAIDHKIPFSVNLSNDVAKGALMSYGMDAVPMGEQAARLADQILKGTKPADLPVETCEFFLGINLQTAEAIDLEIPDDILKQATTIIRQGE